MKRKGCLTSNLLINYDKLWTDPKENSGVPLGNCQEIKVVNRSNEDDGSRVTRVEASWHIPKNISECSHEPSVSVRPPSRVGANYLSGAVLLFIDNG